MSYDVYLEVDAGGPEPVEAMWVNHTSNTAVMWREAGCNLAECDGRPAAQVAEGLAVAIADIEARREHYAQWNPPNGWGSVDTTLDFLRGLLDGCQRYPRSTMRVSR